MKNIFETKFNFELHIKKLFKPLCCFFLFFMVSFFLCGFCSVYATEHSSSCIAYDITSNSEKNPVDLSINAESCLLMEQNSGKVLYSKNENTKMYPASTTKVMTAILTLEKYSDLSQMVNVSYYAVHSVPSTYSIANLQPGEQFSLNDLLHALLIASANDAAYVLAEYIVNDGNNYAVVDNSQTAKDAFDTSISRFSDMMNSKASYIGCVNTHFVNPNGVHNENHYSTAYDLALIGKYAYNNSILMSIVKKLNYSLNNTSIYDKEIRSFRNTNLLLNSEKSGYYIFANGLKTGYTDAAKYCIIASAKKDGVNLIAVILHSDTLTDNNTSRESDCKKLFEFGFSNYSLQNLIKENDVVTSVSIINGSSDSKELNLLSEKTLSTILKINSSEAVDITPEIHINRYLAPIAKGEIIGTVTYNIDGSVYSCNLLADHDVYASNYLNFILIGLSIFTILLLIITLSGKKSQKK